MGWLAGWLGWAGLAGWLAGGGGLQAVPNSVPESSVPFGRGPPAVVRGFTGSRSGHGSLARAAPPAQGGQLRQSHHPSQDVTSTRTIPITPIQPAEPVGPEPGRNRPEGCRPGDNHACPQPHFQV